LTTEFHESTVAYNVESRTVPLNDVFFPSTVFCNMNNVRKSFIQAILKDDAVKVKYSSLKRMTNGTGGQYLAYGCVCR
jgi:hypothetical protein